MDLSFSKEDEAFRAEVRAFIDEAFPAELRVKAENDAPYEMSEVMQWHRILFDKGWVAPGWPEKFGAGAAASRCCGPSPPSRWTSGARR